MRRKGGSMTSMASYYSFIYTIFGFSASHMGLYRGPGGKACPLTILTLICSMPLDMDLSRQPYNQTISPVCIAKR